MPRIYFRSSKGRTPVLPTNPPDRQHVHQRTGSKRANPPSRVAPKRSKVGKRRKQSINSTNDAEDELSEASNDDSEEKVDDGDALAPSYSSRSNRRTGRASKAVKKTKSPLLFDTDEEKDAFFHNSEDDETDAFYNAVDDISDSEGDIEDAAMDVSEAQWLAEDFDRHQSTTESFLEKIDGMSEFGFDNELERTSFSSTTDSSSETIAERHVHFGPEVETIPFEEKATAMHGPQGFSQEELDQTTRVGELSAARHAFLDDPDEDSDLTDDDLPAEAHTAPSALQQNPTMGNDLVESALASPTKKKKPVPPRRRGPPLGIFKFDGDKPWAVLDPTGRKVHFCPRPDTNRHDWLEKRIDEAFGIGSATSSSEASLGTLLDDSDRSVVSNHDNGETVPDGPGSSAMLSGLNGQETLTRQLLRHPSGPSESFYVPRGSHIVGDYLLSPELPIEDFDQDADDILDPTGEGRINFDDIVSYGDEDEDDGNETPISPIYPSESLSLSAAPGHKKSDSWSHLNNDNIMSFRRNNDLLSGSRRQSWDFEPPATPPSFKLPPSPVTGKRKTRNPPYQGDHYKGVTIVERKVITPKRRRIDVAS